MAGSTFDHRYFALTLPDLVAATTGYTEIVWESSPFGEGNALRPH